MKKVFLVFFFFLLPVFSFAANFSVGGGVALTSSKSGGYGEFGVTMYNSSSFEMRNIISIDGYGKNIINNENAAGYFGITEKITFGLSTDFTKNNVFVTPYGFIAGGFAFVGTEVFSFSNMSIFIEAGGGFESYTDNLPDSNHLGNGFARINVGMRGFIKK